MLKLKNYTFIGPLPDTSPIQNRSGVYSVLGSTNSNDFFVVDVGESSYLKTRLDNHDRESCWLQNTNGFVFFAVLYESNVQVRKAIEKDLREHYKPACGVF